MSDFNWKIWRNKVIRKVAFVALVAGLTELAAVLGAEPVPSEYVWTTTLAIEGIELAVNYIKHKYLK